MQAKSPYITTNSRLSDVIAAIQILGAYTWASREWDSWAKKLDNSIGTTDWKLVFMEHPEFFRVSNPHEKTNKEWVSLRWRHGYDRTFDVNKGRELSKKELDDLKEKLSEDQINERLTRKPLDSGQIETLITTAIELHERAIAHAVEARWLIPLLFALGGTILGAILQAALK